MGNLKDLKVDRGNPLMIGATVIGDSVNFAITAKAGSKCEVILYKKGDNRRVLGFLLKMLRLSEMCMP